MTNTDFQERLQEDVEGPYDVDVKGDGRIFIDGEHVNARWNEDAAKELDEIHGSADEMYGLVASAIDKHTPYGVDA